MDVGRRCSRREQSRAEGPTLAARPGRCCWAVCRGKGVALGRGGGSSVGVPPSPAPMVGTRVGGGAESLGQNCPPPPTREGPGGPTAAPRRSLTRAFRFPESGKREPSARLLPVAW